MTIFIIYLFIYLFTFFFLRGVGGGISILEENKYNNKALNHVSLNHAVHYATLQNTDLTIYQETIQLAQRAWHQKYSLR